MKTEKELRNFSCEAERPISDGALLVELASGFTVADYAKAKKDGEVDIIAEAIRRRFSERYILPVMANNKNGFTMMAVSCLMIEALESFYNGYNSTSGQSEKTFCSFFDRVDEFKPFRTHKKKFYKHVRCGILHQAETTGGWKILRTGPLFDPNTLTINATRFLEAMRSTLDVFCNSLKSDKWGSKDWKMVSKKMDAICKNCHKPQGGLRNNGDKI